jgi:hypothetical protein
MLKPILDHLVLDVHTDMDAVAALYRDLGFTLTDRGHHTLGSINHLAMFATDYLELLGWPETGTSRTELLNFPRGLNGLVFKTDDVDETYNYLRAVNLAGDPPRTFSRPVVIDGEVREAKFRTVHVAPDQARLGRIYFCEHLTPELVWRPEWQHHANGVTTIASVVVASSDPAVMAELFRAMFGGWIHQDGERFILAAGRPRIEIVPATSLGADATVGRGTDYMATVRLAGRSAPPVPADKAGSVRLEFIA